MRQPYWIILFVAALAIPGGVLRFSGADLPVGLATLVFGVAVFSVAFLLTWTAEAAETEVSQGIAVALLALIAVLPEYAVDIYFAWTAPDNPEHAAFATANMTGANRLLIGLGWSMVILLFWFRTKQTQLRLQRRRLREIGFLAVATLWSFTIPLRDELSLVDSVVLVALFIGYIISVRGGGGEEDEVELVEPARTIAALPRGVRRLVLIALFVYAAGMILAVAEPFADGLVESGESAGIDEFLLVQWLAPLASEAPEMVIAALLVLRGRAGVSMTALVSSKVNQWTLLVGTLPLAYAISGGFLDPLPLDSRQVEEIFLTSAQSIFAVALLANLRISVLEGVLLLVLFLSQLAFTDPTIRYIYAYIYLALAFATVFVQRSDVVHILRGGDVGEPALETPDSP